MGRTLSEAAVSEKAKCEQPVQEAVLKALCAGSQGGRGGLVLIWGEVAGGCWVCFGFFFFECTQGNGQTKLVQPGHAFFLSGLA